MEKLFQEKTPHRREAQVCIIFKTRLQYNSQSPPNSSIQQHSYTQTNQYKLHSQVSYLYKMSSLQKWCSSWEKSNTPILGFCHAHIYMWS